MASRNTTRVAAVCGWVVVALMTSTAARAGDGCAQLAAAVSAEIDSVIGIHLYGVRSRPRGVLPGWPQGGAASCGTTAAVASAAFSRSFENHALKLDWNGNLPMDPGDYCLSHRLDQCYPGTARGTLTSFSPQFVADAWHGVQTAIARQMPFGRGSDISYFEASRLQDALAGSLAVSLERPARRQLDARQRHRH